jgi:hypothetical protein
MTTEGTMSRTILTATFAVLLLIAFDAAPANISNTPALSGAAHAGTTVKSSKSNTSDRKGGNKKAGNPPTGAPGGRGY